MMAVLTSSSMIAASNNATNFRAWCNFIANTFLLGWVASSDTGQVNLSTVAAPTTTSQVMGYKVYKTNDSFTSVYVKVEFGSANDPAQPSIWITVSTATDGAGNMTGTILLGRLNLYSNGFDTATHHNCFGSGANNRVCFAIFLALSGYPMFFSLERRKDSNIADVDTGVLIDLFSSPTSVQSLCAPFSGVIPTPETGMQFILSSNNPAAYGSTIPEGLRIPCLGPSEPPGRNIAVCMANDYGNYAAPTLTINVTNHVFKHCGPNINTLRGGYGGPYDSATRLMIRYE